MTSVPPLVAVALPSWRCWDLQESCDQRDPEGSKVSQTATRKKCTLLNLRKEKVNYSAHAIRPVTLYYEQQTVRSTSETTIFQRNSSGLSSLSDPFSTPKKTHRRLLEDVEFVSRFSFGNDLVVFLKILHLQSISQLGAFIGVHGGKQRHLRAENVGSYGII